MPLPKDANPNRSTSGLFYPNEPIMPPRNEEPDSMISSLVLDTATPTIDAMNSINITNDMVQEAEYVTVNDLPINTSAPPAMFTRSGHEIPIPDGVERNGRPVATNK